MAAIRLDSPGIGQRLRELYWSARASRWNRRGLRSPPWDGFGQPFNGQSARQRTVDFLLRAFSPDTCIETGTFFGWTARQLASYGVPLYTVEVGPVCYRVAKRHLRRLPNVTLICGDSAVVMRELTGRPEIRRPFLYLDAHWQEQVPLFDEVRSVFSRWKDALVAIDDFHVPNDPGYGYDIYDGVPFSLEEFEIPDGTRVAYPAIAAREETGARRGCVFLGIGGDARAAIERAEGELLTGYRAA